MSKIPTIYRPPMGLPLYWRDEVSGVLPAAVTKYLNHVAFGAARPDAAELELLWDYIAHHINAPCWDETCAGCYDSELKELRALAAKRGGILELHAYEAKAMDIALDPL